MTIDEYLKEIINKKHNNYVYNENEERVYNHISNLIVEWAQQFANPYNFNNNIYISIEKSGSRAKGDAIKGKSDIDIFVSITDRNNSFSIKEYYLSLYEFLKTKFAYNSIRKQNVSIGLTYYGFSIDVTPGKRINNHAYSNSSNYDDHYIYSRKRDTYTQTNIQKHIDLVKYSNFKNEMMILKIWRDCHHLELPSIAIEIMVNEILHNNSTGFLYNNIKQVFEIFKDTILTRRIIDPSNTANNIADSMTVEEKQQIKQAALNALSCDHGNSVDGYKIVW